MSQARLSIKTNLTWICCNILWNYLTRSCLRPSLSLTVKTNKVSPKHVSHELPCPYICKLLISIDANRTCSLFAQLGARGVSVIFSSGDSGVSSACQTNDGKNTTRFLPIFPGSCPFVTTVGGTFRVQPERAASFSAGGFSDIFPRPAYQDAAVTKYLGILGDRWKGLYNPAGRGFPDVAAQSFNFTTINGGREGHDGGTR